MTQEGFKAFGGSFCALKPDEQSIFYLRLPHELVAGEYKIYLRAGPQVGRIQISALEIGLGDAIGTLSFTYKEPGTWIGPLCLKPSRATGMLEFKSPSAMSIDAFAVLPAAEEFEPPDNGKVEKPLGFKIPEWAAVWIDWEDKNRTPPWFTPGAPARVRIRFAATAKGKQKVQMTLNLYGYDQTRISIERWDEELEAGESFRNVNLPEVCGPYLLVYSARPSQAPRPLITQLICARVSAPLFPELDRRICAHLPPDDYHIELAKRIGCGGVRAADNAAFMIRPGSGSDKGGDYTWRDQEVEKFTKGGLPMLGALGGIERPEGQASTADALEKWAEYARAMVSHYSAVREWEVVPAGGHEFRDADTAKKRAAEVVAELRAANREIRSLGPELKLAGLSGPSLDVPYAHDFWKEAFKLGALDSCDAVSARLYPPAGGSSVTDQDLCLDSYLSAMKILMQRAGGGTRSIWDTESGIFPLMSFYSGKNIRYGYISGGRLAEVSPLPSNLAANYIARLALVHLWQDVRWYVYSLDWRTGYAWGLTEQDGSPMPAAVALAQTIRIMKDAVPDGRNNLYPNIIALKFRRGAEGIAALWSVSIKQSERRVTLWPPESLKVMDIYGNPLARSDELEIGEAPIYLTGPREELARVLPRIVAISRYPDRFRASTLDVNLASPGRAESPAVAGDSLAQGYSVAPVTDGRSDGYGTPEDSWTSDNRGEEHFLTFRWPEALNVNRCVVSWASGNMPLEYSLRWFDGKNFLPALNDPEWRKPATPSESFYFPVVKTPILRLVARMDPGESLRVLECEFYHVPMATTASLDENHLLETYKPSGVGAIRNWLVCGPFPGPGVLEANDPDFNNQNANLMSNFLFNAVKGLIPDSQCRPRPDDLFVSLFPPIQNAPWTPRRILVGWKQINQETAFTDIGAAVRTPLLSESEDNLSQTIGYCACYLVFRQPFDGHIAIGSDDGYAMFVDGKLLSVVPARRSVVMNSEQHAVDLAAGEHLLLLKVQNVIGDHGLYVALLKEGNPFTDFSVRLQPSEKSGK
ncbi:MAG TPA: hypothetical protein PL033_09085 [Candidatus Brocadiia bacterium]|nr:hypothetical protein [Candidatus Brocadiia bacterium]